MFDFTRFEKLRAKKGVTKAHIAAAIGRTPTAIQDWKQKKSVPNTEQLKIVAEILGTTPEYLMGETDDAGLTKPSAAEEAIKAALWHDDTDLTKEDIDDLWEDIRAYKDFRTDQRRKQKKND